MESRLPHRVSDPAPPPLSAELGVLPALIRQARAAQLDPLSGQLESLQTLLRDQLADVEAQILATNGPGLAERAGHHLLAAGGKRLRPLCTLLAFRLAATQHATPIDVAQRGRHARDLAVAVELVHAATLLHDDVVDGADARRMQPTARRLHGNEVSIFAGDWLLVAALSRVCATGLHALVPQALATIEQMIFAEVEQAERARALADDAEGYLRVVDGKTAALFRWAMRAGAQAAGADAATEAALVAYGGALGVAFQLTDDALDFDGDTARTGKPLLADLREGKVTLPLILALQERPDLRSKLAELHAFGDSEANPTWLAARDALLDGLRQTGAVAAARQVAAQHAETAVAALEQLGAPSVERAALAAMAMALAQRPT